MHYLEQPPAKILVVDDERTIRDLIAKILRLDGLEAVPVASGTEALDLIRQGIPRVVLLDLMMPDMNGMTVLKEASRIDAGIPIIVVTSHGAITTALEAIKNGAYDYVTKPFENDDLVLTVRRALESRRLKQENQSLRSQVDKNQNIREQLGCSESIGRVVADIDRVAATEFTVLLQGETGSCPELIARCIHQQSSRANGPFVTVDCGSCEPAAIEGELFGLRPGVLNGSERPRAGRIEAASTGTLFIDEVQRLPLAVQARVLRVLQEGHICRAGGKNRSAIDFRLVAATSQPLESWSATGKFRQDLFHRLHEFSIAIPPLRERRDDIVYLANLFLNQMRKELDKDLLGISTSGVDALVSYHWPGNVQELRKVIRHGALMAKGYIEPEHLGIGAVGCAGNSESGGIALGQLEGHLSLKELVRRNTMQVEREILSQTLRQTGGNKAKAARILQIDYKTMHTKAKEYGLAAVRPRQLASEKV